MSNKSLILSNSTLIESKINDYLLTITSASYKVECFYQVVSGKGFKSDQLMLTVYNVGNWGMNVNFNVDTLELISVKTIGKFNKETTQDISNNVCWLYMMKLQNVFSDIVNELQVIEELPEVIEVVADPIQTIPTQSFTAFNRSFSSYDAAFTYCTQSDFDSSHIEVVGNPTAFHAPYKLDLQLFSNKTNNTIVNVNNDIMYFNSYDATKLSHNEWENDISKHNKIYSELKELNMIQSGTIDILINNNYSFSIKTINREPYQAKNVYLVDITLRYINKSFSAYVNNDYMDHLESNYTYDPLHVKTS